jgi:hypothetical protein
MFLNLTEMVFFGEIHVFLLSMEKTYMGQREPTCALRNVSFREYSLLKQTVFSLGNNVVNAPAPDTNGFLLRYTCVSSSLLNWPIWTKRAYLHVEQHKLQEVLLSKSNSILTAIQCATCSSF